MKNSSHPLLVCLSFITLVSQSGAQDQRWVQQFGTKKNDYSNCAAPDGAGGVYTSGSTFGSLGGPRSGGYDAWLARYDGAGNQLWIRQLGTKKNDYSYGAAPDGSGGVYMSGRTTGSLGGGPHMGGGDAWLARYDGTGNQLWIRQLGTSSDDGARAAAADGSGGVYVSGFTYGNLGGPPSGAEDAWLARYDGAGNQLWIRQLGFVRARAVAPDGSGGVYMSCSFTDYQTFVGVRLVHYDGAGNQLWWRQFGIVSYVVNEVYAAAPDGSGGVFLSGSTDGSLGGPNAGWSDGWLAHYDSAGNQLWIRQFGTPEPDVFAAAAQDGSGGVYVSGGTGGWPGAASVDAWLVHYDGAGNQLWTRQLGTTNDEWSSAAAQDGSGGVYIGGRTDGSLGGPNAGLGDAWLARYTSGLGTPYCTPATPNSTGLPGVISATGSAVVIANDFALTAEQLPPGQFGYFLASETQGNVPGAGGSNGTLCLSGKIGRFAKQVQNSGPSGNIMIQVDLTNIPVTPPHSVLAGETWNFQAWFRDVGNTSNFTDAVSVLFK